MDNPMEIVEAFYGRGEADDVDIRHLFEKGKRIHKSTDLHQLFKKDPYPNKKKHAKVVFKTDEVSTHLIHEECFRIKEGGQRIGFQGQSFHISIPNMYEYKVLESSFEISGIEIASSQSVTRVQVPSSHWENIVDKRPQGYYHVRQTMDINKLTETGDPFPGHKKIIYIHYHQTATYEVKVYEVRGMLVKDLVLVEIPKYACTMLYHLFPKFDHPVMTIHNKYLQKCLTIFDRIIVSIAHNGFVSNKHDEDVFLRNIGGTEYRSSFEFLHTVNNQHRGEAVSFMNLLNRVENKSRNHLIFYAHSKGLRHYDRNYVDSICRWVELMYIQCLMNVDTMIYQNANCGGSFKKHCMINGHQNPRWHYSGSFYLFKSALLNRKMLVQRYAHDYFISERCPGLLCPSAENCLVFLELKRGCDNLYDRKSSLAYSEYVS